MNDSSIFEKIQETQGAGKSKVYSVSELNHLIRVKLDQEFASLWLEGEISNFKHHTSGHMYLTLRDDKSQINAVFFSRANQGLKFRPKDGLKVLVFGRISVYEPRGQYQVYVERMIPKGMGELQLAFLQLKEKLEKEGLFDPAHKKPIPKFPKNVGVVTSPTGAAIRDILNVVARRFHGTNILLNPVLVQGDGAAQQVARAIREMNDLGGIDVLIVGRGGGSLEDLWAFNEEGVARAIYASRIPIISAVGHEIDWTIADLVADLRAPTPSAAAELVVQNREEVETRLGDLTERLRRLVTNLARVLREDLESLSSSHAFRQPMVLIQNFSQRLDELLRQLQNYLKSIVVHKKQAFQHLVARLESLSPLGILERGYSLTFLEDGTLVKKAEKVKIGTLLKTRIRDAHLFSKVTKVEPRV